LIVRSVRLLSEEKTESFVNFETPVIIRNRIAPTFDLNAE